MAKPDFLIVGAMKAGTTTLYRDLSAHSDFFLPQNKEPDVLVNHETAEAMRKDYTSLFRGAAAHQLRGEASTAYTKRPTYEGVAAKALALCGPGLKIIYIRRDPIERIVSHYQHERQHGYIQETFAEALRSHPRLVDYSRYDWQIEPWLEAFGADNLLQLDLDSYSSNRRETLEQVCAFLNVEPGRLGGIDDNAAYNRRDEQKAIGNPMLRGLVRSRFYQRTLKRAIPRHLRDRGRTILLGPTKVAPVEVRSEDRRYILTMLKGSKQ